MIAAVGLASLLMAAACGDDSDDSATTTAPSTAAGGASTSGAPATTAPTDVDPTGVLKVGLDISQGLASTMFDPTKSTSPITTHQLLVYDTMLRQLADGSFVPNMAKSVTITDSQTIKVELNSGIRFSDGTAFDAAAVKAGLERNVASKSGVGFGAELFQVDTITVDNPTALTIKLKTPVAGIFYTYFSRAETAIVSPKAVADGVDLQTKPVGAGPFTLESLQPGVRIRLVKNPTYFKQDTVRLAAVEFIQVNAAAQVTAIKSASVDAIDNLQITTAKQMAGSGITVRTLLSDNVHMWSPLCKTDAPLSDVRVRRALNYGVDRDAINTIVFDGKSEPMWGLFGSKNPYYEPTLKDVYKRDVAKAKQLLAEAGYPNGLKLTFLTTAGDPQTISELVQAQWKEIGVDLTLQTSTNIVNDFFTIGKKPLQPGYFFSLQRGGLDKVTRSFMAGGSGNVCDWNNEVVNQQAAVIRAVAPTSAEAKAAWSRLQKEIFDQVPNVFTIFGATSNAYIDRVGNAQFIMNFQGVPYLDVANAYIKKK